MNEDAKIGDLAFFSSLGPTFDGRIKVINIITIIYYVNFISIFYYYYYFLSTFLKPDVVAPGYFTHSSRASGSNAQTCNILEMAGTSMATPCVSGTAAQIRQYFETYNSTFNTGCSYTHGSSNLQFYTTTCNSNSNPRGATIKALLVHSGEKMDSYFTNGYPTKEPESPLPNPPDMYQVRYFNFFI